jgi:hypothetical protein
MWTSICAGDGPCVVRGFDANRYARGLRIGSGVRRGEHLRNKIPILNILFILSKST